MAVRRRRRVVVAGLLVLLTANSLLGLGYGLTAAATPATSLTSAAVGLVLTLILTGVLAVEWRLGDRLLASTDAARRRGDRLAHYDSLTRLPNRRVLERELAECCLGTPPLGAAFALHLVDVDDLKAINDGFGHDTGDDVLRTVAQRLRAAVRDTDLVARLAGDEFVILQRDATPATAANLAQRMVETLRLPLREHTTAIVPTVSIGTALFGPGRTQPNQLLRAADKALYRAKASGRDGWLVLDEGEGEGEGEREREREAKGAFGPLGNPQAVAAATATSESGGGAAVAGGPRGPKAP